MTGLLGPEDLPDLECNGDPYSLNGEEDETGFDDMPVECGWTDEEIEEDWLWHQQIEDEEGEDDEEGEEDEEMVGDGGGG